MSSIPRPFNKLDQCLSFDHNGPPLIILTRHLSGFYQNGVHIMCPPPMAAMSDSTAKDRPPPDTVQLIWGLEEHPDGLTASSFSSSTAVVELWGGGVAKFQSTGFSSCMVFL